MKKVVTLVLAIALVLTSVVALADGTPNINSFATMKVKYHELKSEPWGAPAYWEITLSKPVDRLLINWSGKGEEPEELAVDENLKATALRGSHKYMPGTEQEYVTEIDGVTLNNKNTTNFSATVLGYDVASSEVVYRTSESYSPSYMYTNKVGTVAFEYEYNYPTVVLDPDAPISVDDQIDSYKNLYPGFDWEYTIVRPYTYVTSSGVTISVKGSIVKDSDVLDGIDPESIQAVKATPLQTAFMTVQGEWAVYYNRAGRIVGIEKFDGQF